MLCEKENESSPNAHQIKGKILLAYNSYLPAINCFSNSEENFITEENQGISKTLKEKSYSKLKEVF